MAIRWFERCTHRYFAVAPLAALPLAFGYSGDQAQKAPQTQAAQAVQSPGERVTVPFSDPSRPGRVKIGLLTGSITVKGYEGKDVVVEVRTRAEEDEDEDRQSRNEKQKSGLRRIPNTSSGLTIEEDDNQIEISTSIPNRETDVVVQVPVRTSLELSTINDGSIVVERVEGEIEVSNVNGPVTLTNVAGSVVAHALNDDLKVSLRQISGKPMSFSSMNGDIDVVLPPDIKANVNLETAMGDIYSDFDIDLQPQAVKSSVEDNRGKGGKYRVKVEKGMTGRINGGGPELKFKNFNGDISIRKAK